MSAPTTLGHGKLNGAFQEIKTTLEELEVNIAMSINNVKEPHSVSMTEQTLAKVLGGFALGALLVTATVLPLGTTFADGSNRPMSAGPSYQEQRLGDSIEERFEVQRLLVDMYNHSFTSSPTASESIQERLEVQRVIENMYNHSFISSPTASESAQERLEVERVRSNMLGQ